jgi:hypothetical protein
LDVIDDELQGWFYDPGDAFRDDFPNWGIVGDGFQGANDTTLVEESIEMTLAEFEFVLRVFAPVAIAKRFPGAALVRFK